MNFSSIVPQPAAMTVYQPHKISSTGNLYRIPVIHRGTDGQQTQNYEIWATKEAIQQHFQKPLGEEPRAYDVKKFARQMYEKQQRIASPEFHQHKGVLITTNSVTHGDPKMWPNALNHPEVRL